MNENIQSMLLAPAGLFVPFILAIVFTIIRPLKDLSIDVRQKFVGLFLIGVACQCAHLIEEFSTGIHRLFPPLFGLAPVSAEAFIGFNVFWIGVWSVSAVGFMHSSRVALIPIWFFALAMCLNGVAHPLLSVWVGGYFPGLITSPIAGVMGFLITRELLRITGSQGVELSFTNP